MILVSLAAYAAVVGLVDVLRLLTAEEAVNSYIEEAAKPSGGFLAFHIVALMVVAAGEESIYRVAAYDAFSRHAGRWAGGLMSAVLFAGVHPGTWSALAKVLVFGLLAVWCVEKFRSVLPAAVLHWLVNVIDYAGIY